MVLVLISTWISIVYTHVGGVLCQQNQKPDASTPLHLSIIVLLRNALLTSICLNNHLNDKVSVRAILIVENFTTPLNVSTQSKPITCRRPLEITHGLSLSSWKSTNSFTLKRHLLSMIFLLGGEGTRHQVFFLMRASYSHFIAWYYTLSLSASFNVMCTLNWWATISAYRLVTLAFDWVIIMWLFIGFIKVLDFITVVVV